MCKICFHQYLIVLKGFYYLLVMMYKEKNKIRTKGTSFPMWHRETCPRIRKNLKVSKGTNEKEK